MAEHFDAVIIGGGPGGTPAAMALAAAGRKTLLVEKTGKLGGACLFVGCIPSKIIRKAADDAFLQAAGGLVNTEKVWPEIRKKMDRILPGRSGAALKKAGQTPNLTVKAGGARFISAREIEVSGPSGRAEVFSFDKAVIASGASSFVPPFGGTGAADVLVSERFFNRPALPRSLVIVGGGPIGVELAQMLGRLGVSPVIIESMPTILHGAVPAGFAAAITQKLEAEKIRVYAGAKVLEINRQGEEFVTVFENAAGEKQSERSEQVLVSTGKVPNVQDLSLEAAGVKYSRRGIETGGNLETSVKGIFAVGDVIDGPKFAHLATHEAFIAVKNILGGAATVDFKRNSWVLFTDPEIMSAGYSLAEAAAAGFNAVEGVYDYKIDAAAQVHDIAGGELRFVADAKTKELLGVHAMVKGADSIAGEAALIVSRRLTLMDVAQAIHPHPTLTEAFGFLAQEMLKKFSQSGS